jgi:hypothetical protein
MGGDAVTLAGIVLIAAGVIVALLVVFELLARIAQSRFLSTVILGADGRTSTSKTFIFLWTLLVGWALIALLIAGQFAHTHGCVLLSAPIRGCKGDELGLFQVGWRHFLHAGLSGSYLILLGVPATAGVAAKAITQSQVTGTGFKKPKPPGGANPFARVTEIFSADDGTTDIGDFQYVIFNLVTAAYFVTQFLNPDGTGLPTIPNTLLGLTSVSAGLYVAKKAVTNTQPTVTGVFPQPLHDGQPFTVIGTGLTVDPSSPTSVDPQITIDGMPAVAVNAMGDNLVAKAPPNVAAGGTPIVRQMRVLNPYGGIAADFSVQCM